MPPEDAGVLSYEQNQEAGARDFDPESEVDIVRLRESIAYSNRQLRPHRDKFREAVTYYAGSRYGDHHDLDHTPFNVLRLAVDIWRRQMVSQTPRALILSKQPHLKVDAYELEIAVNHLFDELKLGDVLGEAVLQALFGMGVIKVGLTDPYLPEGTLFSHDSGQPFAEVVEFEDFSWDVNGRKEGECDWMANRYRLPYAMVRDNPDYDPKVREAISPTAHDEYQDLRAFGSAETTASLTRGDQIVKTEYVPHVELWDIYLPGNQTIVTIPAEMGLGPLAIKNWDGPEAGPFHLLRFGSVPGNLMPSPPAQQLYELQDIAGELFNHIARQAQRQKTVLIAGSRAASDGTAERIIDSEDGQVIRSSHPDDIKEISYGGVDPGVHAFIAWLRQIMSYSGGNIDAMGGLAQQGETLGQEKLLIQSSSAMIRDMQSTVERFSTGIMRDLAQILYTDPTIELPLSKKIEGYGDVEFVWGPEQREADFFEYNFSLYPYSLRMQGPGERLQQLLQYATQLYLPLAPQLSQWGLRLDVAKMTELIAKYSDLPELKDIVSANLPSSQQFAQEQTPGRRPLQSPSTSRSYTRTSVSTGGTQEARDNELIKNLMNKAGSDSNGKPSDG